MMGKNYWEGLMAWLRSGMLGAGYISPEDLELVKVTDDPQEAVDVVNAFTKKRVTPVNFA